MGKFMALLQYLNQLHWPTVPHANRACPHPQQQSVPDPSCKFFNDTVSTDIMRQIIWQKWWLSPSLIADHESQLLKCRPLQKHRIPRLQ